MNKYTKRITACLGIIGATALLPFNNEVSAQDIHFTQFNMNPLSVNPAFTGAFAGDLRVSGIYRDQWRLPSTGKATFSTFAASIDMPIIKDLAVDDYLAAGIQLYNDVAGDGNMANFTALASVAYHKFLGLDGKKALTVGIQGGYVQKSLDLSKLYFGDEFVDGDWFRGSTAEELQNRASSYLINAGIAWSHAVNDRFSYVIGAGANNLNMPAESFNRRPANKDVGLYIRYTGQLGAIYQVNERFSLRPAVLFQTQASANEIIAGNEFHYTLGNDYEKSTSPAIFAGLWYRHEDAVMGTVGVEWSGFRLGFGYDVTTSSAADFNNGVGGFEVSLRYIKPSVFETRKLIYPCGRF
ncbi:MAG: PorP/SprF family type IX secretion system membrane protein [Taibaiella sp.]|nr:PorP/SprF family type IX secretion system membrane protein [Taibaiella sp.]